MFSKENVKLLRILSLATGFPTALLVLALWGHSLVLSHYLNETIYWVVLTIFCFGFVATLIVYASSRKKD